MAKARFTANEYQIWYNPGFNLMRLSEWNVCNCHPGDLIETWGERQGQSGWRGHKDKHAFTQERLRSGWILLVDSDWPKRNT